VKPKRQEETPNLSPREQQFLDHFLKSFPGTVEWLTPETAEQNRKNDQRLASFCDALAADVQTMKEQTLLVHHHRSDKTRLQIAEFLRRPAAFFVVLPSDLSPLMLAQKPAAKRRLQKPRRFSRSKNMAHFSKIKNSQYLTRNDIHQPELLTIEKVVEEAVGQEKEQKYVVYFQEKDKALVLNFTNAETIFEITGQGEMDDWAGTKIVLYDDPTITFAGKRVGGLRIRAHKPAKAKAAVPANGDVFGSY